MLKIDSERSGWRNKNNVYKVIKFESGMKNDTQFDTFHNYSQHWINNKENVEKPKHSPMKTSIVEQKI